MTYVSTITKHLRLNEVIRIYPETVKVFHELGLDACCGGDRTVAEAAEAHGLKLEEVLQALEEASLPARESR
jgi:regulator of cell morphogenesis and NO signaling